MRFLLPLAAAVLLGCQVCVAQDQLPVQRPDLSQTVKEGAPLVLELGGAGRRGFAFERLDYTLRGNKITVRALAKPSQAEPAPFRKTLRIPNAEFDGQSWLGIELNTGEGEPFRYKIPVRGALPPEDGMYRGIVLPIDHHLLLMRPSATSGDPRVSLDVSQVELPRYYSRFIKFRGEMLAPPAGVEDRVRVRVTEVLVPERGIYEGVVSRRWGNPWLTLDDGREFCVYSKVHGLEKGQRVRVDAWLAPGVERKNRLTRKSGPVAYVKRVEAILTEPSKPKHAQTELPIGTRVWLTKTRFFNQFAHLEDDAGNALGYTRAKKLTTHASQLAPSTTPATPLVTPGLIGGLGDR